MILGLRLGALGVRFGVFLRLWGQTLDPLLIFSKGSKQIQKRREKGSWNGPFCCNNVDLLEKVSTHVLVYSTTFSLSSGGFGASEIQNKRKKTVSQGSSFFEESTNGSKVFFVDLGLVFGFHCKPPGRPKFQGVRII